MAALACPRPTAVLDALQVLDFMVPHNFLESRLATCSSSVREGTRATVLNAEGSCKRPTTCSNTEQQQRESAQC